MTVSEKEKIAYFRRELSSYSYYRNSIDDINKKIEAIDTELNGVSSPSLAEMTTHSTQLETVTYRILYLWEEQTKLLKEKEYYVDRVKDIKDKLNKLSKKDRDMLVDAYIVPIGYENSCAKYSLSKASLFRELNRIIKKVI